MITKVTKAPRRNSDFSLTILLGILAILGIDSLGHFVELLFGCNIVTLVHETFFFPFELGEGKNLIFFSSPQGGKSEVNDEKWCRLSK